jgi:CheY-like chemotaxis protein
MAYGIVKQHSGVIEVESAPGRGTVVTILLPVNDATLAPVQMDFREPPSIGAPGTETILLVEDEDAVRAMAATILESQGFAVLQARDGVEALEVFLRGKEPIDLVLSDVVMPRMGGVELLNQIRGVPSDVPFIFVSGYASDGHGGQELHSPVPFVAKPWRSQTLVEEGRRFLDSAKKPASGARH